MDLSPQQRPGADGGLGANPPAHVLIVGPGRDFPVRLRGLVSGTRTTIMCQVGHAHKVRGYVDHARVIALHHDAPDAEWVDIAAAVHARDPFTQIATFGERDQEHYAAVADALGLAGHTPETVALVHDKRAMRERLAATGLDTTAAARVADLDQLRTFMSTHGLPVVVKPISSSGSAGVTKITHDDQVEVAFTRAKISHLDLPNPGVLVEQFLEGPELSVEGFSEDHRHVVVSITGKFKDPETFVELGHVAPADLPTTTSAEVEVYVGAVLDALGVGFGPTHTEIVLTEGGPRIIETHVRVGGDEIPLLTLDSTGVDLDDLTVRQLLGETVLPGLREHLASPGPHRYAAIRFAASPGSGTVESVRGSDAARQMPGVRDVTVLAGPGSMVGALTTSESRVASVRTVADAAQTAVERADGALRLIELVLEPGTALRTVDDC